MRVQLWSSGGGVQSVAIASLIANGKLPKPDLAVMVDTGREASATLKYNRDFVIPLLLSVGVHYEIVHKSGYTDIDLVAKGDSDKTLPPFFTTFDSENPARQPGWCSNEWKARVVQRWANKMRPGRNFDMWLGISTDELSRAKPVVGKFQKKYPLIDLRMSRGDCYAEIGAAGLPFPPRSSCWMCPNRTDREWQDLKDTSPEDFQSAIEFERELRGRWPWLTLHSSGQAIDKVKFSDGTGDLFAGCDSGMCFV